MRPALRSAFKTTCVMCLTGELFRNGVLEVNLMSHDRYVVTTKRLGKKVYI